MEALPPEVLSAKRASKSRSALCRSARSRARSSASRAASTSASLGPSAKALPPACKGHGGWVPMNLHTMLSIQAANRRAGCTLVTARPKQL